MRCYKTGNLLFRIIAINIMKTYFGYAVMLNSAIPGPGNIKHAISGKNTHLIQNENT
jgi:hypothetical protein